MKNHIKILILFSSFFSYGQESLLNTLNKKGLGTFNLNGQFFSINRTVGNDLGANLNTDIDADEGLRNTNSLALTLDYESPKIKNFSINLSYIQAIKLNEYSSTLKDASKNLQNSSFGLLNNFNITCHLDPLGLKKGTISVGRFSLDTEFMTQNKIRQKSQAFEGGVFNILDIGNWDITLGYLSKFSSWKSDPHTFESITLAYDDDDGNYDQEFIEAVYNYKNISLKTYYILTNNQYSTLGINYSQKVITFHENTYAHILGKGIMQQGLGENSLLNNIGAMQLGASVNYKKMKLETGVFSITGTETDTNTSIQTPFAPNFIISEPLLGTDYNKGMLSYYLESSYLFPKGKIYVLYLHTKDKLFVDDAGLSTPTIYNEFDFIASHNIYKKLQASIKVSFLNEKISNNDDQTYEQTFDYRFFLNYSF